MIISFRAGLYYRTDSEGVIEYALAFAGTYNDNRAASSWMENVKQIAGLSVDMQNALECSQLISKEIGDCELTMIGHSKGGAEAAGSALVTNRDAFLYNPAKLNDSFISEYPNAGLNENGIISYISSPEILDCISISYNGHNLRIPGEIVRVDTRGDSNIGSLIKNHSITVIKEILKDLDL